MMDMWTTSKRWRWPWRKPGPRSRTVMCRLVRSRWWAARSIARRHNERELTSDPTAHAELLALRDAATALGRWRLDDVTLIVTLEPCAMCAGALVNARLARVVFGAADPKAGAVGSLYNLCVDPRLNHEVEVQHGVMAEESAALLHSFFADLR